MKLSKDELLGKVKDAFGDSTDEKYISLLEDISDSMEDVNAELTQTVETLTQELADLKQKYIERFFTADETQPEEQTEEPTEEDNESVEDVTIDELFEDDKKEGE